MKNREYYTKEILDLVCSGKQFAVDKMGKVVSCISLATCSDCLFNSEAECVEGKREWAEAEYKEPLSAKTIAKAFSKYCGGRSCKRCKYSSASNQAECHFNFVLDNYDVKEKEARQHGQIN